MLEKQFEFIEAAVNAVKNVKNQKYILIECPVCGRIVIVENYNGNPVAKCICGCKTM